MDCPTPDSCHLNLKLCPQLSFCIQITQDGEIVTFLSDYCLKII